MAGNLLQDWPVYLLLGAVIFFFIHVIIEGHKGGDRQGDQTANKNSK